MPIVASGTGEAFVTRGVAAEARSRLTSATRSPYSGAQGSQPGSERSALTVAVGTAHAGGGELSGTSKTRQRTSDEEAGEGSVATHQESWIRRHLHRARRRREKIRHRPTMNLTYRVAIGVLGGVVLVAGLLMIPYPGPGWLVVFAGLGILATEFAWAHQVNQWVGRHYRRWTEWLKRQNWPVRLCVMGGTGLIVLATLWLLNVFALVGGWFGVDWAWLGSPLLGGVG